MTIQQLNAGRELINAISERESKITKIREYMNAYIDNLSEDDELDLTISTEYVYGEYVGSFSAKEICTLFNNRIVKVEEEIKELKKRFESL